MPEMDAFIKRVESELRDISRKETKLSEQEDLIKRQRSELRSRGAELTRSLNVYRDVMGVSNDGHVAQVQAKESPTPPSGTIADLAEQVIIAAGGRMTTNDIVDELQKLGRLKGGGTSGRGDYGTVYRTLLRDDHRFSRVDKGVFAVKDTGTDVRMPG